MWFTLQRHLYAHVFKHKELGASKKLLTLVADDRKPVILHGQILATHPSDVVKFMKATSENVTIYRLLVIFLATI